MKDYIRKDETDNKFRVWNRFWMAQCTESVDFRTKIRTLYGGVFIHQARL